jgi:hypothetical protein
MANKFRGASREALHALHAAVLNALLSEFGEGRRPSAAILHVCRRFLKDNGIVVDAMAAADLQRSLEQLRGLSLPFTDKDTNQ